MPGSRDQLAADARAFLERIAASKVAPSSVAPEDVWSELLRQLSSSGVRPIEEASLHGVRFDLLVPRQRQKPLAVEFLRTLPRTEGTVAASTGAARQISVATGADVAYVMAGLNESDPKLGFYSPNDVPGLLQYEDPLSEAWSKSTPAMAATTREAPRVFAAMPFDTAFNDVFLYAIAPAAEAVGASAKPRIDAPEYFYNDEAISEIKAQIDKAVLVVADVTGCRANVMYECGYADGIGRPVIHITSDKHRKLPFDIQGRPTLKYTRGAIDTLKDPLKRRVAAAFAQRGARH